MALPMLNIHNSGFLSIARNIFFAVPLFQLFGFLVIFIALFTKNPDLYLYPALISDDRLLFVYHFHRFINEVNTNGPYFFYANSFLLIPNICATLFINTFPLEWVPRLFAFFSLFVTTTANWLFCLRAYSVFVSSHAARFIICLLVTILPIGSWPLQSSLLWQSWNFFIIIVLLIVIEPSIDNKNRLWIVPLVIVSIFSTPGSIIILPWFVLRGMRCLHERQLFRFFIYILLAASTVLFAFLGMNALGSFYKEVLFQGNEILRVLFLICVPRVVLESFFPQSITFILRDLPPVVPFLFAASITLILCIAAYAVRTRQYFMEFMLFAAYVIIAMTLLSVIRLPLHDSLTFSEKGFRYFYVQKFVFLIFASICIYQLVSPFNFKVKMLLTAIVFVVAISFAVREQYRFIIDENITYAEYKEREKSSLGFKLLRDVGMQLDKCLDSTNQIIETMEANHKVLNVDVCFVCHVQE